MTTSPAKATQTSRTFRMECATTIDVRATPQRIWALLTNAADFPRWNSTVTRITGTIAQGERLALEVPAAPGRTFKPRVVGFNPEREMVWSDGFAPMFRGVRTFTLAANPDGTTAFSMVEVLSGVMLPMIKGSLPDFGPSFEAYAADLKREAERTA
ncbi:MAG TPA: SRPBCC domain-containing protein [Kofleriaceae bacterium]